MPQTGRGQGDAGHGARASEEQPLGEELPDQPPAVGAEGRAERHLPLPPHQPRQAQVGDVGTGDEEYEGRGAEQEQQGGSGLRRELRLERGGDDAEALVVGVVARVLAVEPLGDAASSSVWAWVERDARRQAPEQVSIRIWRPLIMDSLDRKGQAELGM